MRNLNILWGKSLKIVLILGERREQNCYKQLFLGSVPPNDMQVCNDIHLKSDKNISNSIKSAGNV